MIGKGGTVVADLARKNGNRTARTARIGLRATLQQDALIRRGAEATRKSVTEFILNSSCAAAENALLDQKVFFADDESWKAFSKALDKPAEFKPRLAEVLKNIAPWEK
jgi:uncharacterized protein (DUF1778 family)